jgi:peptide deformylase
MSHSDSGTARPITVVGNPVLHHPCAPVEEFGDELAALIDDMFASMYAADGVGLAANQIGVELSVFVYDCPDDTGERHRGHVVNPVLVSADGPLVTEPEGCLSLPGLSFDRPRYAHAVVEGVDRHGAPVRVEGEGYFARCLQHETDHLTGHVYTDGLTGDVRREALRAIRAASWSAG